MPFALVQGVAQCFQLDEGEIQTEPTPSRDDRRCLLFYESSEGGAGVLSRLVRERGNVAWVARTALALMHYQGIDEAVEHRDVSRLTSDADARCVKGCYRCLLSYYNQPDHELIDRTDDAALMFLLRLARAKTSPQEIAPGATFPLAREWKDAFLGWKLPPPDGRNNGKDDGAVLIWSQHALIAFFRPPAAGEAAVWDSRGFTLINLPQSPPEKPPTELLNLLGFPVYEGKEVSK